ncbi:MAG: protein kinase [Deltaproteobacteria bacterium]|nr:protein kinase [Deltaproteobacteria bacterium]
MGADSDAELRARAEAELRRTGRSVETVRQIHIGQTISMGHGSDGVPRIATAPARDRDPTTLDEPERFPVPNWDRYQSIRLLGQGGMGRVFLARDLRLHRNVAIKFVRGDDPDDVRRMIAEARSQARVNDERVCKVFDVGEVEGRVYIAMQHIDGRTLTDLVDDLTFEQKALVLRGAALGVNEAHRVGLIHRDLKPSNIMVERAGDGELRPYVMDFGLARDWSTSDTMTGTVLGTPQFMAPEQARGEVKQLDRRADVYSLGATLYALLTDRAPVEGGNPLEILSRVSTVEPVRPRALVPDLPLDLEAIVLKCLEKDRGKRYDSARALADDLGRFLAGEPVLARVVGPSYRLRKWLRRRWRPIAATTLALAVTGGALAVVVSERQAAARREALARSFSARVEHIEAQARYSALARLHDIRPDRAQIRAAMDAITAAIADEGDAALGPGHYALGQGYLALGDDARAEDELRAAWQTGFRDPRAAYALALALGHRYQHALREVELLPAELRAARRAEVEARYRDPARAALRESDGAEVPSREYVAALLAYYEGRFDDALRELDAIEPSRLAWFYEAPLLRGEILRARVTANAQRATPAQLAADLADSRRAIATAAAIGESDPAVHVAAGELEATAVRLEVYGSGEVTAPFDRGVAAAGRALALVPDDVDALTLRSRLERRLAEYRGGRGEDASTLLTQAVNDAQRALAIAPARDDVRLELAQVYLQWGEYRQGRGEDPAEQLRQALDTATTIATPMRDAAFYTLVGNVHLILASFRDRNGQDSLPEWSLAIDAYQSAIRADGRVSSAWLLLGNSYAMRAAKSGAADPDGDLRLAVDALEKGRMMDPSTYVPSFYQGNAYAQLAERAQARGDDPSADSARAVAAYQQGLRVAPRVPILYNGISIVRTEQAVAAWDRGDDPGPLLAQAIEAATQAIVVAPDQGFGFNNLGDALSRRVTYERVRGRDPRPAAGAAITAFTRALARIPDEPTILVGLASVHVSLAAAAVARGEEPEQDLGTADSITARVIAANPSFASAHQARAAALAVRARWQSRAGRAASATLEDAAHEYRRAHQLEPANQDILLEFGMFCRQRAVAQLAAGADPRAALDEGRAIADQMLAARPAWTAARALTAGLRVLEAASSGSPDAVRRAASAASAELAALRAGNPNLDAVWRAE